MHTSHWRIAIDAGGTFTDCLAHSPQGEVFRLKVLSNGSLRARVVPTKSSSPQLQITAFWTSFKPKLEAYALFPLGNPKASCRIERVDWETGMLWLDAPLPESATEVVITAHEEAPTLAARLLTGTPLGKALPPLDLRLGSTRGTNALLERKGARVACLITAGLEDLPLIRDQRRPDLFALNVQQPSPLHTHALGVQARMDAQGQILIPLTQTEIARLVAAVQATDCEAVAISLLHAYRNPAHEQQLAAAFRAAGYTEVSSSHELAPLARLLPRTQTALANAYLSPVLTRYLDRIASPMSSDGFQVMTSAGGLQPKTAFFPKDSLISGPAGGVVGAAHIARRCGYDRLLTLDMGGTSSDVARYDGTFDYEYEVKVGDAHLMSPAVAVHTVAAGGGSICTFDGQRLQVGPESAGAYPGPACYGAGGPLTLTDVNFLLDRLDPSQVSIPLHRAAAADALSKLLANSDLSAEEMLGGFLHIANEKMAAAVRHISVQQGYDPQDYALLAFGGAGGQHACAVADLLGIQEVIIPRDAGILSAVGIGQAVVERFAQRQVLQLWEVAHPQLLQWQDELIGEAQADLLKQGIPPDTLAPPETTLHLRFVGQSHSLEVSYSPETSPLPAFEKAYRKLYGHWLTDRPIEVTTLKVVMRQASPPVPLIPRPQALHTPNAPHHLGAHPVYLGEELAAGTYIAGPALVVSALGTTFIEAGWQSITDEAGNLHITRQERNSISPIKQEAEAIQLALFGRRFQAVAEEMGALLQRTSVSVNVKERLDFSCALLDAGGYLVANAPHIPVHLGSMGVCTRAVCAALDLQPGDVAITNHPGFGGSHLPDVTLVAPVHTSDGTLMGYVANRAHHAEIGGKRPGSMPPDAQNLQEEGVVIPPMKLVEGGIWQGKELAALFTQGPYPTRHFAENEADLQAALASIRAGSTALLELVNTYGRDQVQLYMQQIQAYAADRLKVKLAAWPDGVYEAAERLDDGSPLHVKWKLAGEKLTIDLSGSAAMHAGNLNANLAIVNSAILYVLRLWVDEPIPLNEGFMRPVDVHVPQGMLNPAFSTDATQCPAVVGGNVETSQRLVDTLLKALGLAACSQGTMNNLLFGNDAFGYYETIGGGTGAGKGFHGASGVHQHMTNTRMTDPEIMELRYPVRVWEYALRKNSGGAGKWQGGNGIRRRLEFLSPVALTVLTQHRVEAPYGLSGGSPGLAGSQCIIRQDGTIQTLSGIDQALLNPGDQVEIETPGGGGYGVLT